MSVTIGVDSYGDEAGLDAHAARYGITISLPTGSTLTLDQYKTTLLYGSMDSLETNQFLGIKTSSTQALQFPRYGIVIDGYDVDSTTVPADIVKAQYIGAMKIYEGYDLQSTIKQSVKRRKVEGLEVEYQDNTNAIESHRALDDILRNYVQSGCKVIRT